MIPFDPQQLAQSAMELLKTHWTLAAVPLADGALKEAGKSLVTLLQGKLTSKAASGALEEAAEAPGSEEKAEALALQIRNAAKGDSQFAESLRTVLGSVPQAAMNATQVGDKNVTVQINNGDLNRVISKVS